MTKETQKEFENWAQAHFANPNLKRCPIHNGKYAEEQTQIAWEAWKAAWMTYTEERNQ